MCVCKRSTSAVLPRSLQAEFRDLDHLIWALGWLIDDDDLLGGSELVKMGESEHVENKKNGSVTISCARCVLFSAVIALARRSTVPLCLCFKQRRRKPYTPTEPRLSRLFHSSAPWQL